MAVEQHARLGHAGHADGQRLRARLAGGAGGRCGGRVGERGGVDLGVGPVVAPRGRDGVLAEHPEVEVGRDRLDPGGADVDTDQDAGHRAPAASSGLGGAADDDVRPPHLPATGGPRDHERRAATHVERGAGVRAHLAGAGQDEAHGEPGGHGSAAGQQLGAEVAVGPAGEQAPHLPAGQAAVAHQVLPLGRRQRVEPQRVEDGGEPEAEVTVALPVDREAVPLQQRREVGGLLQLEHQDPGVDGVRHPGRH